ncbi:MAG: hypothetical protein AB7L17_16885 [Ilumatobacteraceae bacterium]
MGNRGKVAERELARKLRAEAWTLPAIAAELRVSKSSVSLWCRDVGFVPGPRHRARGVRIHPLQHARQRAIAIAREEAEAVVAGLGSDAFLAYGIGLYHGEGAKTGRSVRVANTSPELVALFAAWLRRFFEIDETRLRVRLYLHDDLDLEAASRYWSELLNIPLSQFQQAHRPRRREGSASKHPMGCATVVYSCAATYRRVMALVEAITSWVAVPG